MSAMPQMASFLGMSCAWPYTSIRDLVVEIVESKLTSHASLTAPPPLARVTSLAPPSTDAQSLAHASLVGGEGEGQLAVGVHLQPQPIGFVCWSGDSIVYSFLPSKESNLA